jgi:FixJ family two-component response regulator
MRVAKSITVTDEERVTLQRWARGRRTPVQLMQRAKMILMAANGRQNKEIAETLDVQASTVGRWRKRFARSGLAGIEKDAA